MSDGLVFGICAAVGVAAAGLYFLLLWLQGKLIVANRDRALRLVAIGAVLRLGLMAGILALVLSLNQTGGLVTLGAFMVTHLIGVGLMAWTGAGKGEQRADS